MTAAGHIAPAHRTSPSGETADIDRLVAEASAAEDAGDLPRARDLYLRALAASESTPLVHYKLGRIYYQLNDHGNALAFFARACELLPHWPEAQHNLGVAAMSLGLDADAAHAFGIAAQLRPEFVDSIVNRVTLLTRLGMAEQALDVGTAALERHGSDARLWTSLSAALADLERPEAEDAAIHAIRLDPAQHLAWLNLGNACARRCADRDAIATYGHGLDAAPDSAELHTALAFSLLRTGDLPAGFDHYEWRFALPQYRQDAPAPESLPLWRGEPPAGRRILLIHEQGHGDTLQFIRYARELAAQGAIVLAQVPAALQRLVAGVPGIERCAQTVAELLPADYYCPLMSLPHRSGTSLAQMPASAPYLSATPEDIAAWRTRLAGDAVSDRSLRVGFAWAGDPRPGDLQASRIDRRRSLPYTALERTMSRPGVAAYSLQKGSAAHQAAGRGVLIDHMSAVNDFADTAALIHHLDLVVTVDTSVAHLAAGMGKPTWMLSRFDGCWRWLDGRIDSPWYPTLRLFRQDMPEHWCSAVARLTGELDALAAASGRASDTEICNSMY